MILLVLACSTDQTPPAPERDTDGDGLSDDIAVDWGDLDEIDEPDNDSPATTPGFAVELGQGIVWTGSLEGSGWTDGATPEVITDPLCPNAGGTVVPLALNGDYLGDQDFIVFEVPAQAGLCGSWDSGDFDVDVLLFRLDSCRIPTVVENEEGLLGARGEGTGNWRYGGEGGTYAVSIGAWSPQNFEVRAEYEVRVAVVDDPLCPE